MTPQDTARVLTEWIVSEMDLAYLGADGGAWFALELLDVLARAVADGWTLTPPDDGWTLTPPERDMREERRVHDP